MTRRPAQHGDTIMPKPLAIAGASHAPPQYADALMSTQETAEMTGLSERTLERKRLDGTGPRFVKLGRRTLYRRGDVLAWVQANTHDSTSAATVAAQREGKAA
jgi:predicted DNA-binding transcriptional regulator AlpA